MATVVSLTAGEDQEIDPKADAFVLFRTENSDKRGLHGGDLYSVIADKAYWAVCGALTVVDGMRSGDAVDVAWTRMDANGTKVVDDPWRITCRAAANGALRVSLAGQFGVDPDVRLRLRIYNPNAYPVTVTAATLAQIALVAY